MAGNGSPSRAQSPQTPIMSLEAALDEERREVMAALEGEKKSRPSSPTLTRNDRTATPPAGVRSMLGVDTGPMSRTARHGSIAGIGVGITSPLSPPSRLNPADPTTWTRRHHSTSDQPASPPIPKFNSPESSESVSGGLPKVQDTTTEDQYQFDMSSAAPRQLPLRAAQGEKRPREGSSSAMAAAISGDFSSLHVGLPKGVREGRHNSTAGIGGKSTSPSSRITPRPESPKLLSPTNPPTNPPAKYTTDSGKAIDMNQAYRRLSNKSGNSGSFSTINSESDVDSRVPKDELKGEDEEEAVESSEEDEVEESSSDEESARERGRRRARRKKYGSSDVESDAGEDSMQETDDTPGRGQARSLLAAAEEERVIISKSQPVKSLLDSSEPTISITSPADEKMVSKKTTVHPATSFDHATASAATSVASSDAEDADMADITKARKLGLNVSHLDQSVPDRVVRIILRGDWQTIQAEADDGLRRQRLYIVATDLSDEAVYALEWTIGTILRDGDTLLAFCAMGDETLKEKNSETDREALTAEGEKAARDAQMTMDQLTDKTTTAYTDSAHLSPQLGFQPATKTESISGSVDARNVGKAQRERLHAVEDISSTCVRLLRKTRLQVRICVEVVTCRSPKHLITGAIDTLGPTLVVLGSRGRSALKGVLLGSFSNYLVTKSSVPVMVARKKLRKHTKKPGGQSGVRLSNNLSVGGVGSRRVKLEQAGVESGRGKFRGMKVRS